MFDFYEENYRLEMLEREEEDFQEMKSLLELLIQKYGQSIFDGIDKIKKYITYTKCNGKINVIYPLFDNDNIYSRYSKISMVIQLLKHHYGDSLFNFIPGYHKSYRCDNCCESKSNV